MKLRYIIPLIFLLLVSSISGVTVSGGVTEDIPIDKGIAEDTVFAFDWKLDKSDLPDFMDTSIRFQGQYYDVHDELFLRKDTPSVETSLTSKDDDYESNIFLEVKKKGIYYMLMVDDGNLNISKATKSEPFEVDFLGKKIKIIDVPDGYNDRFEAIVGDRYYMYSGDIVHIDGKQITLVNVGAGGQVEIDVDGYQDMVPAASVKFINGIEIYLDSTFYASEPYERAAVMYIGNPAVRIYRAGDPYIGEDEVKPDWKWTIDNLGQTSRTEANINADGFIEFTGPYIGIYNNFQADDSEDAKLVGIGECYSLPNDYAKICLDSLNIADTDYLPVTIEYVDNVDLSDAGLSANEKAIHIHASGDDRLILKGEESACLGPEYFMDVGDVVTVEGKQITLVNVGSGGSIIVDVDGTLDTIPSSSTETVNGIEITVDETFYASAKSERAAILIMGEPVCTPSGDVSTSEVWLTMIGNELGIIYRDIEQIPDIVYFGNLDISTEQEFLRIDYQDTKDNNIVFKSIKGSEEVEIPNPGDPLPEGVYYINQIYTRFFTQIKLDINGDSSLELNDGVDDLITTWYIKHDFIGNETVPPFDFEFTSLGLTNSLAESDEILWSNQLVELGKKDEDHRTKYGVIIKDPLSNGASDRVVLQIPSDQVQANVVIKSKEVTIEPEPSLIVDILNPINDSTISTNSVWLDVMTNKNAVCSYTLKKCTIPEPQPEPEPVDCSVYDGMTCQEIIDYTNDVLERPYAYCECGEVLDMCTTNISALACPASEPPECGVCGVNAPVEIPTEDGLFHSILFEDINPWGDDTKVSAELTVNCQDVSGNIIEDFVIFIIDLTRQGIMEEYIYLEKDWNLFSIPLTQPDTTTEIVISDIQNNVEVIYGYENGQWKVWRNSHPANNLLNLEAGKGYFIKLTEPVVLYVNGTIGIGEPPIIPTFNVYEGWNLIGYYGTEDTLSIMALRNVWNKYSAIWTLFDNTNEQSLQGNLKGFGMGEFDQELKRTHGYWLYMQEDGIIVPTN